jgi:hypothetical protein
MCPTSCWYPPVLRTRRRRDHASGVQCHLRLPIESYQNTTAASVHLLDYTATHPDAILWYTHNDMVLHIHRDTSYRAAAPVAITL